jgi:hypothetical protein
MNHHHCDCEHTACEHTRVAYCKTCDVVYCLDCKMEWLENHLPTWIHETTTAQKSAVPNAGPVLEKK